jgi:hypothetical protein
MLTADDELRGPGRPAEHPEWCEQGRHCSPPKTARDGTAEWSHERVFHVGHGLDCDLYVDVVRMDAQAADGTRTAPAVAVRVTADGSLTAQQALDLGEALLQAGRLLAAGLSGTPGDPFGPVTR